MATLRESLNGEEIYLFTGSSGAVKKLSNEAALKSMGCIFEHSADAAHISPPNIPVEECGDKTLQPEQPFHYDAPREMKDLDAELTMDNQGVTCAQARMLNVFRRAVQHPKFHTGKFMCIVNESYMRTVYSKQQIQNAKPGDEVANSPPDDICLTFYEFYVNGKPVFRGMNLSDPVPVPLDVWHKWLFENKANCNVTVGKVYHMVHPEASDKDWSAHALQLAYSEKVPEKYKSGDKVWTRSDFMLQSIMRALGHKL